MRRLDSGRYPIDSAQWSLDGYRQGSVVRPIDADFISIDTATWSIDGELFVFEPIRLRSPTVAVLVNDGANASTLINTGVNSVEILPG